MVDIKTGIVCFFDGACEPTLLAWMAGFVDGEGCLTITRQDRKNRPTPQWRPFITIANTHKQSLEIFHKQYGGTLRFNAEKRASKTGVKWSDSWTWYCQQTSVKKFCEDLLPFLVVKKEQAKILLSFINNIQTSGRLKGGRNANGTFIGSFPLPVKDIEFRNLMRDNIHSLNSGKRFKTAI